MPSPNAYWESSGGGTFFTEVQSQTEWQQALITRRQIPIREWEICFHSDRGKILSVDTLSSGMLRPGQDAFQSWSCSDQGAGLGDLLRSLPT